MGAAAKKRRKSNGPHISHGQYSVQERHVLVIALLHQLPSEARQAFMQGKQRSIDLRIKTPQGKSVVTAAVDAVRASHPAIGLRSKKSVRASMIQWFQADDITGAPRRNVTVNLTDDQCEFLKRALVEFTYVDEHGNKRRHANYEHFEETRKAIIQKQSSTVTEKSNAQHHLNSLASAQADSKKSLTALLKYIVKRFKLQRVRERLKVERQASICQAAARTLHGARKMTEPYYASKQPPRNADGSLAEPDVRKVMRYRPEPPPGSHHMMGPRAQPLYFDEGAWQITCSLDGMSVHLHTEPQVEANWVWREVCVEQYCFACRCAQCQLHELHFGTTKQFDIVQDLKQGSMRQTTQHECVTGMQSASDWLPVYKVPNQKDIVKAEKQYYMVMNVPDHGVVEAVALQSGCVKTQDGAALPKWFDRMVQLKLGSEALRDKLAARVWSVRLTHHTDKRCSNIHSPQMQ